MAALAEQYTLPYMPFSYMGELGRRGQYGILRGIIYFEAEPDFHPLNVNHPRSLVDYGKHSPTNLNTPLGVIWICVEHTCGKAALIWPVKIQNSHVQVQIADHLHSKKKSTQKCPLSRLSSHTPR